jgi:hypothetical protein
MAGEQGLLSEFPEAGASSGGDAFNIAIYMIVSMVVLVGIAYLFSRLMSNRKLQDWAKTEFIQVMISAALVGGLFFLMAPDSGIIVIAFNSMVPEMPEVVGFGTTGFPSTTVSTCGLYGVTPDTAICYAHDYLGQLAGQIVGLMAMIFSINLILDVLSKLAIDIIVVEISPLAGLSSVVQVLNSIMQMLLFLGITVQVERSLLQFIDSAALSVFLPIGVVLRSFFATRRLGGTLIALAVGLYLVFPLTIALNSVAVRQVAEDSVSDIQTFLDTAESMNLIAYMSTEGDLLSAESWTTFLGNYKESAGSLVDALKSLPSIMMTMVSLLLVQIVFLPILSVMLTIIAIRELGLLFGGEINLSRFEV